MKLTTVSEADDGIRLDRWFARHYPSVTHSQIQKALRSKLIRVDNKRAEANQRLEAGQVIKHPEFAETPKKLKPSNVDMNWLRSLILCENDHIIALNKPAGLATQGGTGLGDDHVDALLPALGGAKLVHRLDKDTSGVLLLAKDSKTAARLTRAFATKEAEKTYWALVAGVPTPQQGLIDAPLAKVTDGWQEIMAVVPAAQGDKDANPSKARREAAGSGARPQPEEKNKAQKAQTEYRVIEALARKLSWLELVPLTGRTHQLRVHCQYIGHPIIGDGKYGGREAFLEGLNLPNQLHLHARRIVIPGLVDVIAPLPPHMAESWEMLGLQPY